MYRLLDADNRPTDMVLIRGSRTYLSSALPSTGVYSLTVWFTAGDGTAKQVDAQVGVGASVDSYCVLQDNGFLLSSAGTYDQGLPSYACGDRVTVTADMNRRLAHYFLNGQYLASLFFRELGSAHIFFSVWARDDEGENNIAAHCAVAVPPPSLPVTVWAYAPENRSEKVEVKLS